MSKRDKNTSEQDPDTALDRELEAFKLGLAAGTAHVIALAEASEPKPVTFGESADGVKPFAGYGVYFADNKPEGGEFVHVARDFAHATSYVAKYGTAQFLFPPVVLLVERNGTAMVNLDGWDDLNRLALLVRDGGVISMGVGAPVTTAAAELFAAAADPS
jgi:hypothetical protein